MTYDRVKWRYFLKGRLSIYASIISIVEIRMTSIYYFLRRNHVETQGKMLRIMCTFKHRKIIIRIISIILF